MEKTSGGNWSEVDGEQILTMGGSGTSGTLRFKNPQGDYFLVALGVHNYKRWCDIVVDITPSNTGTEIHPTYYSNGARGEMLWKQLASLEKTTSKGVRFKVEYYKEEGHTFWATITIS